MARLEKLWADHGVCPWRPDQFEPTISTLTGWRETTSRLAIVGRYLLMPSIFEAIIQTAAGYGGEIQITDALQLLADSEGMYAYRFTGKRFDTGRPLGLLTASIHGR